MVLPLSQGTPFSCSEDPVHSHLLQDIAPATLPTPQRNIPSANQHAVVSPVLKSPSLDPTFPSRDHSISFFPFIEKLLSHYSIRSPLLTCPIYSTSDTLLELSSLSNQDFTLRVLLLPCWLVLLRFVCYFLLIWQISTSWNLPGLCPWTALLSAGPLLGDLTWFQSTQYTPKSRWLHRTIL